MTPSASNVNSTLQNYLAAVRQKQAMEEFQKQHDLAQKQLEEVHSYHQQEVDKNTAELEFRKQLAAQNLRNTYMEHVGSGLVQPNAEQSAPITGVSQGFSPFVDSSGQAHANLTPQLSNGGTNVQLGEQDLGGLAKYLSPSDRNMNIASPEKLQRQEATGAGMKKSAEIDAELPLFKQQQQAAANLKALEMQHQENLQGQKIKSDQDIAKTRANATLASAATRAAATKYAADVNSRNKSQIDASELGDIASQVAMGIGDIPTGTNGIHVRSILKQAGQVPLGKKTGDSLNQISDLDGIFQDMKDAASKLGTSVGGVVGTALQSHIPLYTTETQNKLNQVSARAPQIVRNVMGVGSSRLTNFEIQNAMKGMVNGTVSQSKAMENISKLERDVYSRVFNDVLGSVSNPQQRIAVIQSHGGLEKWKDKTVNYKGKDRPIVLNKDGHDFLFDPNSGTYDRVQ